MDMRRNVLLTNPNEVSIDNIRRMDDFWGNHSWKDIAYIQRTNLFGDTIDLKQNIKLITSAFAKRISDIAQFKYIPEPIPMRNSRSSLLYFLFFASNNKTGNNILTDILKKYRDRGIR